MIPIQLWRTTCRIGLFNASGSRRRSLFSSVAATPLSSVIYEAHSPTIHDSPPGPSTDKQFPSKQLSARLESGTVHSLLLSDRPYLPSDFLRDMVVMLLTVIISQLLLLSGDIEKNPGPIASDEPTMDQLISLEKTNTEECLRIIRWIASLPHSECVDFAHLLLKDAIKVGKHQKIACTDEFVRAVLHDWLSSGGDSKAVPRTWADLADCMKKAGLPGDLVKAIRETCPSGTAKALVSDDAVLQKKGDFEALKIKFEKENENLVLELKKLQNEVKILQQKLDEVKAQSESQRIKEVVHPTLQTVLRYLNEVHNDWFVIGVLLCVPERKLYETEGYRRGSRCCMVVMIQLWLESPNTSWVQAYRALELVGHSTLASAIKQQYLWDHHQPSNPPTLRTMLRHLDAVRDEWFVIGAELGIPVIKLKQIEYPTRKYGSECSLIEMIQYWLGTTPNACWEQVANALVHIGQQQLASIINQKYICGQTSSAAEESILKTEQPTDEEDFQVRYTYCKDFVQPTLQTIVQHLIVIHKDWFELGKALRFPDHALELIKNNDKLIGSKRKMAEMCEHWTRNCTGDWENLVRALEQLKEFHLASTIRNQCMYFKN